MHHAQLPQHVIDELADLLGRGAPARARTHAQGRGAEDNGPFVHIDFLVGHHDGGDAWLGTVGAHDVGGQGGQRPFGVGGERDAAAGQDRGAHGGQVAARLDGEAEVGAELLEPGSAGRVAGRGDDRLGAQHRGHPAGQVVAAALVRAEHRDRVAQIFVYADYGGVFVLAGEQGGDEADGGADGEEADDRLAFGEGARERLGGGGVVASGVGPRLLEPLRGRVACPGNADEADHWFPQRTKTGFSAASRSWPFGRGRRRDAWSWTPPVR